MKLIMHQESDIMHARACLQYICRDQGADFNGLTSIFVCLTTHCAMPTRAHLLKNVARIPRQRQHRFPLDHGDGSDK